MSSDCVLVLEKIADVVEAIAQIIPPYQQVYSICKRNEAEFHGKAEDHHLAALLSYVYADFVQLFLELYRILCRGAQSKSISCMTIVHGETRPELWRPLDSRFAHLETRLGYHKRWLEKETADQTQYYMDISQHRKNYVNFLQRQSGVNTTSRVEQEEQRLAKRARRVEKVQHWLSTSTSIGTRAPDHQQLYQKSCAWFLHIAAYAQWRSQQFDSNMANNQEALVGNWQHRVLFVQGKSPRACLESLTN
jgi:hypothetical protein